MRFGRWPQPGPYTRSLLGRPGDLAIGEAFGRIVRERRWLVVLGLAAVHVGALVLAGGLDRPPNRDEGHFWETSQAFAASFPPSLAELRDYPEVLTPLAFVLWGGLEAAFGGGMAVGRLLNALLSFALLAWVALGRRHPERAALAALRLLAFPYTLPLGVHLYTDTLCALGVVAGVWLYGRERHAAAALAFVVAVATRQYAVFVPSGIAAYEAIRFLRGERERLLAASWAGLAAGTLLGWFAFFGGLAPPSGMAIWIPRYAAPMLDAFHFELDHGLYFLSGVGLYFVLPEWVLLRRRPPWHGLPAGTVLAVVAVVAALFWMAPPLMTDAYPGGAFGRVARAALPGGWGDLPRMLLLLALACAAVLRLSTRPGLVAWWLLLDFLLMTKSQLAWEKYLLPFLAVLWLSASRGPLVGDEEEDPAAAGQPVESREKRASAI